MNARFDSPYNHQDRQDQRDGDGRSLADDVYGAGPTQECARVAPLLEAFYDGALDAEQTQRVAGHLGACAFCAARLRRYAEVDQLIRAAPAPVAGPALRAGVYRAIAAAGMDTVVTAAVAPRERHARDAERSNPGRSWPGRSFPGDSGNWRPVPPRTPRAVWAAGAAALCIILAFAVVFIASRPGMGRIEGSPTASATVRHQVGVLPPFSDWRAAYLDQVSGLHVVSLDGKSDTLVTTLDGLSTFNSQAGAAISPDGRYLAYIDNPKWGNIHVVDLRATTPAAQAQRTIRANVRDLFWSPDGRWLLVSGLATGQVQRPALYRVDPFTGTMTMLSDFWSEGSQAGWLDADHLLITMPQTGPSSSITPPIARAGGTASAARTLDTPLPSSLSSGPDTYYVLDVAAGTIQAANGITVPAGWTISIPLPGTTEALVEAGEPGASCGAPCPDGQPAYNDALLDYATGQITQLPKINGVAGGNILSYAVVDPVAGSGLFVATPYVTQSSPMQLFLFDPAHDGARPLATGHFAVDWTPDGQTLLLGDAASQYSNTGAGALSTLNIHAEQVQPTAIGQDMVQYLGLVRSA